MTAVTEGAGRLEGRALARALAMSHGWNSTAYQILNPGIRHWFNQSGDGVVGYVRRGGYLLAAGGPICEARQAAECIREFEQFARELGCRVCYVCADERLRAVLELSRGHSVVTMGAQPVWDPARWDAILQRRPSLRAQLHRASNKGVTVEAEDPRAAARDPALRNVLLEWLDSRRLPPMRFMVEPEVLAGEVEDRVVLVARREQTIVAYLVASPIPLRNGYLVEELARSSHAPNGTSELLIDAAMRHFAAEGRTCVTLGLVALAHDACGGNPLWIRALMHFARAHANRFYNFRGLERFRAKMEPASWENIYLISTERHFSPGTLYAVGGAFSGISPVRAVALGLLKAMGEELRTLRGRLSR